jgi:hypothetical protein
MKKIGSVLLALVLAFSFVCIGVPMKTMAISDEDYGVAVGDVEANSRSFYILYDDGSVTYDESSHTLYLNNASIKGFTGIQYGFCKADNNKPFTIVLSGKNYIETEDHNGSTDNYGIRSDHFTSGDSTKLVIKGDGSLNIKVYNTDGYGKGIAAGGGLTIKGKANVKVTMDDACKSSAISLDNDGKTKLKLDGSAKLTAYSPKGKAAFYEITPVFGKKYTPKVKAGYSASDIKVNKKNPSKKVYTKYNYISIKKA